MLLISIIWSCERQVWCYAIYLAAISCLCCCNMYWNVLIYLVYHSNEHGCWRISLKPSPEIFPETENVIRVATRVQIVGDHSFMGLRISISCYSLSSHFIRFSPVAKSSSYTYLVVHAIYFGYCRLKASSLLCDILQPTFLLLILILDVQNTPRLYSTSR